MSLLSVLGTPRKANFVWTTVDTTLLLPDGLEQFFTGHALSLYFHDICRCSSWFLEGSKSIPGKVVYGYGGLRGICEDIASGCDIDSENCQ